MEAINFLFLAEIIEIPVVNDTNKIGYSLEEVGGTVGGLLGGFIFAFLLIKGSINNRKSRKHIDKSRVDQCENNPDMSTRDQEVHKRRLMQYRKSRYKGTTYYLGPRSGYYWIAMDGTKVYC